MELPVRVYRGGETSRNEFGAVLGVWKMTAHGARLLPRVSQDLVTGNAKKSNDHDFRDFDALERNHYF